MRNYFIFALLIVSCLICHPALAQYNTNATHQQTASVPNARFDIIQSSLAAQWTFRLDRYTGNVWQLVKTKNDGNAWEFMYVNGLPKIKNPNKPRFIIFSSGIAARYTFLMDSVTGKTWIVTTVNAPNKDGSTVSINVWVPFES